MINEISQRNKRRRRRKMSVSKRVRGTALKPRLSVYKSNMNLFAQLIDDENGKTLASAGTLTKETKEKGHSTKKGKEAAKQIGMLIAEKAKMNNIQHVIFDRGHNKYHGLLAELASAAREGGLQF